MSFNPQHLAHNLIHGANTPLLNRWFDKSFSLIVQPNGLACINFEHSWGDGVAVLRLMEDVYADSTKNHFVAPNTPVKNGAAAAKPIGLLAHFVIHNVRTVIKLDDALSARVKQARIEYKQWTDRLDFSLLQYTTMTRDTIKKHKLSPDAVIQAAIQVSVYVRSACRRVQAAFYKLTGGKRVATYESCSTAAFKHGRTETMRPATMATNAFVDVRTRTLTLCARAGTAS
jgi:carnitine O-palmitoyltransferase 2